MNRPTVGCAANRLRCHLGASVEKSPTVEEITNEPDYPKHLSSVARRREIPRIRNDISSIPTNTETKKILKNYIQTVDNFLKPCYYISVIDNDYHY